MVKSKAAELAQVFKKYAPYNNLYDSIDEMKILIYHDRGSITLSGGTTWIDITGELIKDKPY